MAKIYTKKNLAPLAMKPKKEVVSFLLNYSKALSVFKVENINIEVVSN